MDEHDAPSTLPACCSRSCSPRAWSSCSRRRRPTRPAASESECANTQVSRRPATSAPSARRCCACTTASATRAACRCCRRTASCGGAAQGHSTDMVAGRYFAHDSPSGADMADRILRTGYGARPRAGRWARTSPGAAGSSPPPRRSSARGWTRPATGPTSCGAQFREIGIGIALGAPVDAGGRRRHLHDRLRRPPVSYKLPQDGLGGGSDRGGGGGSSIRRRRGRHLAPARAPLRPRPHRRPARRSSRRPTT